MFVILGCIFLIFIPFIKFLKPRNIDQDDEAASSLIKKQQSLNGSAENSEQEISYLRLFSDPIILLLSITQILTLMAF